MKKKSPKNVDVTEVLVQIQAQLAALDQKLEAFINKSLTDIAGTLAAQKAAAAPRPVQTTPPPAPIRPPQQNSRPKFAIVCHQCGKDSELPFKPTPGRSVYCPDCFAMRKAGNLPKVNSEMKLPVEVQTPVQIKVLQAPVAKAKKKAPAAKKPVAKKTTVKKTKKKSARK